MNPFRVVYKIYLEREWIRAPARERVFILYTLEYAYKSNFMSLQISLNISPGSILIASAILYNSCTLNLVDVLLQSSPILCRPKPVLLPISAFLLPAFLHSPFLPLI
jgi:hypothetical protein